MADHMKWYKKYLFNYRRQEFISYNILLSTKPFQLDCFTPTKTHKCFHNVYFLSCMKSIAAEINYCYFCRQPIKQIRKGKYGFMARGAGGLLGEEKGGKREG